MSRSGFRRRCRWRRCSPLSAWSRSRYLTQTGLPVQKVPEHPARDLPPEPPLRWVQAALPAHLVHLVRPVVSPVHPVRSPRRHRAKRLPLPTPLSAPWPPASARSSASSRSSCAYDFPPFILYDTSKNSLTNRCSENNDMVPKDFCVLSAVCTALCAVFSKKFLFLATV